MVRKGDGTSKARLATQLDRNPVVKFEEGKLYLENQEVTPTAWFRRCWIFVKTHQENRPGEAVS
jgi:hypothetical protein